MDINYSLDVLFYITALATLIAILSYYYCMTTNLENPSNNKEFNIIGGVGIISTIILCLSIIGGLLLRILKLLVT